MKNTNIIIIVVSIIIALIIAGVVYGYQKDIIHSDSISKNSILPEDNYDLLNVTTSTSTNNFLISGYIVFVSPFGEVGCGMLPNGEITTPCDPEYDFMVVSDINKPISSFPSTTDPHFNFISVKEFKKALYYPLGEKVKVSGIIDKKISLKPPFSFPMIAKSVTPVMIKNTTWEALEAELTQ